jgi:CHAD domain-containing protein
LIFKNPFHLASEHPDSEGSAHLQFKGAFEMPMTGPTGIDMRCVESRTSICDFYDSYVWSLWFQGGILALEGAWFFQSSENLHTAPAWDAAPRFASDFGMGDLRDALEDSSDIRALRKTASAHLVRDFYEGINSSGQVVVRLASVRIGTPRSARVRTTLLEIQPVEGCDIQADELQRYLLAAGCRGTRDNLIQQVYQMRGVRPVAYSLKPHLQFAPETHCRTVLLETFNSLLSIARWNEEGIIKDIDTEFLHDYRVSLRKLRSVIGLIKGVFPDDAMESWKRKIGMICRETNALRDLDVYILSRARLERMLPEELHAGLDRFFRELETSRTAEAKRVAGVLKSESYKKEIDSLQAAWTSPHVMQDSPNAMRPIGEVAGERILKRFRRIRKIRKSITPETPDATIHGVRIDCKKMRYLLECFGCLFPEENVAPLARQLAKLQNRLGRYNDTSVQQDYLLKEAEKHIESGDTRLALSLGGLIGSLHHQHALLRTKVLDALEEFCRGSQAARASRLSRKSKKEKHGT